jgi:hypothetical protein
MFNKNKVFITIEFWNVPGFFDYPKHLPLPRKDDSVHLNGNSGTVDLVRHGTTGTITTIRIICRN